MRDIVCGGRDFGVLPVRKNFASETIYNAALVLRMEQREFLMRFLDTLDPATTFLIHGGASGADRLAGEWATANGVPYKVYSADWSIGKAAGPMRNTRMLVEGKAQRVIAFAGGKGTGDMIKQAEKAGIIIVQPKQTNKSVANKSVGMPKPFC